MKILVLLLARLGDTYMAWPTLRALRRQYPDAELNLIVREKFRPALSGLEGIDKIHCLPVKDILAPLIAAPINTEIASEKLDQFIESARADYQLIINLSYSPLSSYLVHALQGDLTTVCGYTRTRDGFLEIPDDLSAYFYAQVGVGKQNRHHLTDIFAATANVELANSDWHAPVADAVEFLPRKFFAVHIGASQQEKSLSAAQWAQILDFVAAEVDVDFVLLGSAAEIDKAMELVSLSKKARIVSEVGKTTLSQVFYILQHARCLVGCDSAPMHMAALTKTAAINFSFSSVNHSETGPRSMGSTILLYETPESIDTQKAAVEILGAVLRLFDHQQDPTVVNHDTRKQDDFQWDFIKALYMETEFPKLPDDSTAIAFAELKAINDSMIDWLENKNGLKNFKELLMRGEEVIETIGKVVPRVWPLISWYRTEKIRIGPGPQETILANTVNVHKLLKAVLDLYIPDSKAVEYEEPLGEIL